MCAIRGWDKRATLILLLNGRSGSLFVRVVGTVPDGQQLAGPVLDERRITVAVVLVIKELRRRPRSAGRLGFVPQSFSRHRSTCHHDNQPAIYFVQVRIYFFNVEPPAPPAQPLFVAIAERAVAERPDIDLTDMNDESQLLRERALVLRAQVGDRAASSAYVITPQ